MSPAVQVWLDKGLFDRLPVSFSAFCLDQIKDWDLLFPAEGSYFERLFGLLDRSSAEQVDALFSGMRAAELRMGVNQKTWPKRQFTLEQVDFLNRNPHYAEWRQAVSQVFARLDPILDAETARKGQPRLAVILSPAEIPADAERMWLRVAERGKRIAVEAPENPDEFLSLLLTGKPRAARAASLATGWEPYQAWIIEAGSSLSALSSGGAVKYSYAELSAYRKRLMTEVNGILGTPQVRGPRELSARLKQLKVMASEGAVAADPILAEFARATLLSGNGTLLINNTFVEWATVQAVRRARPRVTVASFGVRNKVKPFSSLLIYADQEADNPIPTQQDTLGTYVDLEMFYQYIYQEFEKYAEYRRNTVYLFAGGGVDQILVIGPPDFALPSNSAPLQLTAVHQACRAWLGL